MTLEEQINQAIRTAMLAKESQKLQALRAVKSAILLEKTSGNAEAFDSVAEIRLLQRLIKQRRESAAIYESNSRKELAEQEQLEADVIAQYLPQQLTEQELFNIVRDVAQSNSIASGQEMGKLMGLVNKKIAGRAEGKHISEAVKTYLGSL